MQLFRLNRCVSTVISCTAKTQESALQTSLSTGAVRGKEVEGGGGMGLVGREEGLVWWGVGEGGGGVGMVGCRIGRRMVDWGVEEEGGRRRSLWGVLGRRRG